MTDPAVRVLGIDVGRVRIGLALSDPLGLTAQPLPVLLRRGPARDCRELARLVRERGVTTAVVGLPLMMSGAEGSAAAGAREFAAELGKRIPGLAVELWDERWTSVEAERMLVAADVKRGRRRTLVDGLAAALILQNYLDARTASDRR